MLKNPIVLVGVAVAVALGVWLAASALGPPSDPAGPTPLAPPPGEGLRRQAMPRPPPPGEGLRRQAMPRPPPPVADPARALERLAATPDLGQGDSVLRELLKRALDAGEKPSYRTMIDVPADDAAARQIKDEVHDWLVRKMAGLGFAPAAGRPTVLVAVHVNPSAGGSYTLHMVMRSGGEPLLDEKLELPAAGTADRLDSTLGQTFGSAPAAAAAAAGSAPPEAPAGPAANETKP